MPTGAASERPAGKGIAAILVVGLAATAQEPASPEPSALSWRLRAIEIERGNVFTPAEADSNWISRLANSLHWTTREDVVRREVWLRSGQRIGPEDAAELARQLRAGGWFQSVETELVQVGDDEADLLIRTRDQFSLTAFGTISQVGGATRVEAQVAERNMLGTGKSIETRYSAEGSRTSSSVYYEDRQFLDSWQALAVSVGVTDDGEFGALRFERPFKHLRDPWRYGVTLRGVENSVDYYRLGDVVAEIPQQTRSARFSAGHGSGPIDLRTVLGVNLSVASNDRDPTVGVAANDFPDPADADYVELGASWSLSWVQRYVEVTRIDSLNYTEDLPLGIVAATRLAVRHRDAEDQSAELQPVASAGVRVATEPLDDVWITANIGASSRWSDGSSVAHRLSATLHGFWRTDAAQTLAASATFTDAREDQDFPVQLTLGEDNGLRGYPAREFAGQRVVRLNFEDRIDTGVELWAFRFGVTTFADTAFIDDPFQGLDLGDPLRSVGVGLRIGSIRLFGRGILRVDVAWPLDDVNGEEFGPSVSVTFGQVFTFFGNRSFL